MREKIFILFSDWPSFLVGVCCSSFLVFDKLNHTGGSPKIESEGSVWSHFSRHGTVIDFHRTWTTATVLFCCVKIIFCASVATSEIRTQLMEW